MHERKTYCSILLILVVPLVNKEYLFNFIENFNVPLPPKEKQEEIVAHISQMRARAKKLQAEGAEVLQKAKMEVERMILG